MLKPLLTLLRRVAGDLETEGVPFALVGGLAVGARTRARYTSDLDLAVAVARDRQAEELVRALLGRGYRLVAQLEHLDTHRFATVRLLPPAGMFEPSETPIVDLLFATCGIEKEIIDEAEALVVDEGFSVRVARTGHLLAQKLLSRHPTKRPQDFIDAVQLAQQAGPDEIARSRRAVRLITERGYARDKGLEVELDALLKQLESS